jgi:hypothetical protein
VQLAEASGSPFWVQIANMSAGLTNATLGRWDTATAHLERWFELAQEAGMTGWSQSVGLAGLADVYRATGHLADAREHAEAGVERGRREAERPGECRAQIALARVLIAEGAADRDAIDAALLRAEALVGETRARALLPFIAEARSELARARGDAAGAARTLAEAHRLFSEMGAAGHVERVAPMLDESPE